jgi:hypothetical protein
MLGGMKVSQRSGTGTRELGPIGSFRSYHLRYGNSFLAFHA